MARNGDRTLPASYNRFDLGQQDRSTENRAVQSRPDCGIGASPHLFQRIFLHPLEIGGNGGTFHSHMMNLDGVGSIHCHLIVGGVPIRQTQIIVFCFQIHKRKNQFILDHLPQNTGHFIPIHLHNGIEHWNLFHPAAPLSIGFIIVKIHAPGTAAK